MCVRIQSEDGQRDSLISSTVPTRYDDVSRWASLFCGFLPAFWIIGRAPLPSKESATSSPSLFLHLDGCRCLCCPRAPCLPGLVGTIDHDTRREKNKLPSVCQGLPHVSPAMTKHLISTTAFPCRFSMLPVVSSISLARHATLHNRLCSVSTRRSACSCVWSVCVFACSRLLRH